MNHILNTAAQAGQLLAGRRKTSRLSQQWVADRLGISQNRLSELEEQPGRLTLERLIALANVLGLELVLRDRAAGAPPAATDW